TREWPRGNPPPRPFSILRPIAHRMAARPPRPFRMRLRAVPRTQPDKSDRRSASSMTSWGRLSFAQEFPCLVERGIVVATIADRRPINCDVRPDPHAGVCCSGQIPTVGHHHKGDGTAGQEPGYLDPALSAGFLPDTTPR